MESIGKRLQETRERLGISLDEVENTIRIRVHHLEAIERGDFETLPSPVQARGFLHNYAEFLGLDADNILLDYADKLQKRGGRKEKTSYQEPRTQPSVVLIWGASRIMTSLRNNPGIDDVEADFLIPTVTISPEVIPQSTPSPPISTLVETIADDPTPTQFIPNVPASQVSIRLNIEKRVWLLVIVDGEEQFRGRLTPGDSLDFVANEIIEVSTGNAAGVRVFYNGQDQGLLGELGQVVTRLWTLDGPLTPTPTQTGTPTQTPTQTNTPTATLTPFFTPLTPTQSSGG
jgi:transcriptional regulator with XRE-family HTH domain